MLDSLARPSRRSLSNALESFILNRVDVTAELSQIVVPSLFVASDSRGDWSPEDAERAASLTPGARAVTFEVKDTGIGIPPRYHARIFERFFRVDKGRSRDEGGSGLGLAIVRHLVNRMGGTIGLESAPGEGSRFVVTMPIVA